MAKTIIKEIIIALLVCLAVLLILSVILYDFIPTNKVIPEAIEYQPSSEVEVELNAAVDDHSDEIIKTYEITASDLDNFERTDEYLPGKANPFAAVSEDADGEITGNDANTNVDGTPIDTTTGNNSGGSLFENGSSK